MRKYTKWKIPNNPEVKKIFRHWNCVKTRCSKQDSLYYKKGIIMHPAWANDFWEYYNYVTKLDGYDANKIGTGKDCISLDRINNAGNYEPNNVRWADKKTQFYNSSIGVIVAKLYNKDKN